LGHKITGNPLVAGNRVALLKDGDDAFPAKLAAIERAKASIELLTCIFDSDPAGECRIHRSMQVIKRSRLIPRKM